MHTYPTTKGKQMHRNNQFTSYFIIHVDYGDEGSEAIVDERSADRETVVSDLVSGEYAKPWRIDHVDLIKGTVTDVSHEIADEAGNRVAPDADTPENINFLRDAADMRALDMKRKEAA